MMSLGFHADGIFFWEVMIVHGMVMDIFIYKREREREETHTIARLTSLVGMTPSFSPSMGSANSAKASLISRSSRAEMLCSFASFDCRSLGSASLARLAAFRFGGCVVMAMPC